MALLVYFLIKCQTKNNRKTNFKRIKKLIKQQLNSQILQIRLEYNGNAVNLGNISVYSYLFFTFFNTATGSCIFGNY